MCLVAMINGHIYGVVKTMQSVSIQSSDGAHSCSSNLQVDLEIQVSVKAESIFVVIPGVW
jgi:hypothetical protein